MLMQIRKIAVYTGKEETIDLKSFLNREKLQAVVGVQTLFTMKRLSVYLASMFASFAKCLILFRVFIAS